MLSRLTAKVQIHIWPIHQIAISFYPQTCKTLSQLIKNVNLILSKFYKFAKTLIIINNKWKVQLKLITIQSLSNKSKLFIIKIIISSDPPKFINKTITVIISIQTYKISHLITYYSSNNSNNSWPVRIILINL